MERAFKGIWIDKKIWLDPDLLLLEKVLIAEIDSLEGENGCFAGNEYFANFFGVAKGTIANLLSKLSKKNYIKVESDFGANRRIFVNPEIKGVHSEMKGGSRRNERGFT